MKNFKMRSTEPVSNPKEQNSETWEIGDEVYLDYGESGRIGPGKICAKLQLENESYYAIAYKAHGHEMSAGWYDGNWFQGVTEDGSSES